MKLKDNLYTQNGWQIEEKRFDKDQIITTGSNFLTGNGYLGYRGTMSEWDARQYVGCFVTDTYDMADGKWRELCNVPNGLFTRLYVEGKGVSLFNGNLCHHNRKLNMKHGIFSRELVWESVKGRQVQITAERFASYDNLHLIPFRYRIKPECEVSLKLITGIDGNVWNLNGKHLGKYELDYDIQNGKNLTSIKAVTGEDNIEIDVVEGIKIDGAHIIEENIIIENKKILREYEFTVTPGEEIIMEKVMVVYTDNDVQFPYQQAKDDALQAINKGYHKLKALHQKEWEKIWDISDVKINGDLEDQTLMRFNLYHNIIATPAHSENLPIGARGLSCQAYQGAAFWDQEIFNLPMFLYTRPEIARDILKYRYNTLTGAREKAENLGYKGAFYAWISGKTGKELCPSYFFKNVLTGRRIHNHFNDWQIHVSPDIAYACWNYYLATGDWEFIVDYGAEMIFEIARFLHSHVYFKKDKNRYEFIRLLGPDEYHENVDNNAYTNYMAKATIDIALRIYREMNNCNQDKLKQLVEDLDLDQEEIEAWEEMSELIYLPEPDKETGLIEQFDGYFDLEDVTPDVLEGRLQDPGEYWGWPNGVAVETQVIKQADVIQLFCLDSGFSPEVMEANYNYYEPRTEHGSSLSPSAYALIAARIGKVREAYKKFRESCTVDLYNTNKAISGGTFIGGIHTAACGAAWQMIVKGFCGLELSDEGISFSPVIPEKWQCMSFKLVYHNQRLDIEIKKEAAVFQSSEANSNSVNIQIANQLFKLQPGSQKRVEL